MQLFSHLIENTAIQTEEKLKHENIKGNENANKTHFEVVEKVRNPIEELGNMLIPNPVVIKQKKKKYLNEKAKKEVKKQENR